MSQPMRMSQRAKDRWSGIKPSDMARAIFQTVQGDVTILKQSALEEKSVWKTITRKLNAKLTEDEDAYWLKLAFDENRKQLRNLHQRLCEESGVPFLDGSHATPSRLKDVHCYCGKGYSVDATHVDASMIQCGICSKW